MQIMDMHRILCHRVAQFVRGADDSACLEAAASDPASEGLHVMVSPVSVDVVGVLRHRRSSEFAGPDHDRVVEQASLLQVLDERVAAAVHLATLLFNPYGQLVVMIPVAVIELDESDIALGEPSR
jgi:hypothetical protein